MVTKTFHAPAIAAFSPAPAVQPLPALQENQNVKGYTTPTSPVKPTYTPHNQPMTANPYVPQYQPSYQPGVQTSSSKPEKPEKSQETTQPAPMVAPPYMAGFVPRSPILQARVAARKNQPKNSPKNQSKNQPKNQPPAPLSYTDQILENAGGLTNLISTGGTLLDSFISELSKDKGLPPQPPPPKYPGLPGLDDLISNKDPAQLEAAIAIAKNQQGLVNDLGIGGFDPNLNMEDIIAQSIVHSSPELAQGLAEALGYFPGGFYSPNTQEGNQDIKYIDDVAHVLNPVTGQYIPIPSSVKEKEDSKKAAEERKQALEREGYIVNEKGEIIGRNGYNLQPGQGYNPEIGIFGPGGTLISDIKGGSMAGNFVQFPYSTDMNFAQQPSNYTNGITSIPQPQKPVEYSTPTEEDLLKYISSGNIDLSGLINLGLGSNPFFSPLLGMAGTIKDMGFSPNELLNPKNAGFLLSLLGL